jgi:hypothetical protein
MVLMGWGMLLDYIINTFVIEFGTIFNSGELEAVALGTCSGSIWLSIYFLDWVYIGFKMILNSDDAGTKRNLILSHHCGITNQLWI